MKKSGRDLKYEKCRFDPSCSTVYNPPNSPDITTAYGNLNEATANSTISDVMIRTKPFFKKTVPAGVPTTLFDEVFSTDLKQNFGRDRLLAKALPALTTPVGGLKGGDVITNGFIKETRMNNMNDSSNKNDWPDIRKNDGDLDWKHSDIKNVAYPFVYKIFNMITQ